MFGYVKPDKPELKIKEFESYKAVYCSVCKTLGKEYGLLSRMMLTYDATFYCILLKAVLQDTPDCATGGRCRFNPLKKCNYIPEDDILKQAAGLTVIMFYYKVLDNIKDASILKKLSSFLIYPYIKIKFKKAVKNYSFFNDIISLSMEEQWLAEENPECSTDLACDPSAKALGKIFAYNITDENTAKTLYRLGYCVGRWVYLTDAFDDLESDIKHSGFNPFIIKYGLKGNANTAVDCEIIDGIMKSVRLTANEAASAFDLLDIKCYRPILENIVYDGMEAQLLLIKNKKQKEYKR